MNEFRRFAGYLAPFVGWLAVAVVAMVLVSALRLVFPLAGKFLVDVVLPQQDYSLLNWFALGLLALVLVQTLINVGQNYLLTAIGERMVVNLRTQLYAKLQALDLRFFTDRSVGELTSRLTSDVTAVQTVVTTQATSFFTELLVFLGALGLIVWINAPLAGLMLLIIPPVVLVARLFGKRLRQLSTEVQDRLADATAVVEETMGGVRVVKSFVREPYEQGRYGDAIDRVLGTALQRAKFRALFVPMITFSGFGGLTLVLWFGGRQLLAGEIEAGDLLAFLFYTVMIAGSTGTFAGIYSQVQEALGALRRLFELLDEQPAIQNEPNSQPLPAVQGRLTFEHVDFAYEEAPVLHDIDLDVAAGEVLALVGPSGGGKTTLFNLIPRFYDPARGRVTIDGIDIRTATLDSLRAQIGIVPQETLLFSRTVKENILYGRLDAADEEVIAAARAANAHEFISQLPAGYDTQVGERGLKLSGGQRQRIAIARTLLKNPRILLLDEATSALDSESESLIQEALERLLEGRTTLIIAHRLSTVQVADRVAVIDRGRIVELGTHDELLARGGMYAHLYALQFRTEVSSPE